MKIRSAAVQDAAAIAKVQVDSWRTTYHGLISERFLQEMSYQSRAKRWTDIIDPLGVRNCTYVVENNGVVVGFASAGSERSKNYPEFEGELYAIYLFADVQGNGLGRRLMSLVAEDLIRKGISSMLVWVLADNRSGRAFYESFRPEPVDSKPIEIDGENLIEMAYGWKTLAPFKGELD